MLRGSIPLRSTSPGISVLWSALIDVYLTPTSKKVVTRIKVIEPEFEAAESGGCVYGKDLGRRHGKKAAQSSAYSVYVELGMERRYILRESDDSNLKYRLFTECHVHYALCDEDMDNDKFAFSELSEKLVIYCDA